MNTPQTVALLCAAAIVATFGYAIWESWRLDVAEAKERHEQNRLHWLLIDRIQQYGYHRPSITTADELINHILGETA